MAERLVGLVQRLGPPGGETVREALLVLGNVGWCRTNTYKTDIHRVYDDAFIPTMKEWYGLNFLKGEMNLSVFRMNVRVFICCLNRPPFIYKFENDANCFCEVSAAAPSAVKMWTT